MPRVTLEIVKSVRIRSITKSAFDGRERVTRSKLYASPHTAAQAYAQSSAYAWAWRRSIYSTVAISHREKKTYDKVRPYFDKLFAEL